MRRWQVGVLVMLALIVSIAMVMFASPKASADFQQTNRGITLGKVARKPVTYAICPDPAVLCHSRARKFADFELQFRLPQVLRKGQTYRTDAFYAVIIKTYAEEACDADDHTISIEEERIRIQQEYPTRKVFGSYSCPNMDAVDYDFPGKLDASGERVVIMTYLAVYAGANEAEAETFAAELKKRYPDSMLKRMTASYEVIDQ